MVHLIIFAVAWQHVLTTFLDYLLFHSQDLMKHLKNRQKGNNVPKGEI